MNDKSVTLKLKDVKDYISLNVNIKKEMEECIFIEESSINGNYYFFINDSVEITTCESKIKGKKVAILWDSSHSRGLDSRSIKTDILFMEEFLKINNECSLDIIQFHHQLEQPKSFTSKEHDKILQYLETIQYDGGTNLLANVQSFSQNYGKLYDWILLFSDGMDTMMDPKQKYKFTSTPIYSICSSIKSSKQTLKFISQSTGGRVISINGNNLDKEASLIGNYPFSFLYADYKDD